MGVSRYVLLKTILSDVPPFLIDASDTRDFLVQFRQELIREIDELRRAIHQAQQLRLDVGADILVINAANGLILKDAQSPVHYWRLNANNANGQIQMDDLGTSPP